MDGHGTPKARPGLRFANRVYENSPLNPNKRPVGTPQTAPSRRVLNRDEPSSRGMDASVSYSAARNIFRTSSMNNLSNPSTTPFSPSLPAETKTKVFAPGATPASQKVFREATAQATPRGMAAPSAPVELFTMRIPSPPPEYSGEKLARRIPRDLDGKGSVYADQFLADLVPAEYDDLQRRQLFCILDLRRLKHSANEIFAKKDWKLNISNFAKEYEKSRSLIMLRYGLYEWKGKKPDPAVMRKWRAANGLPDQEEEPSPTPTKRKNKRKADEELPSKESIAAADSVASAKRRAFDKAEAPSATPATTNKRKASVSDESEEQQPTKQHKSSATKAMFEQAFNNKAGSSPFGAPKTSDGETPAKPSSSIFGAAPKPVNGGTTESVLKARASAGGSGNIFGHLSDNSAQNSGQDADTESEADEDDEENEAQDAGQQSDEPSVVASGGADTPSSQPAGSLFGQKPLAPPPTSAAASRESTPGRSLFDRVQKGTDGQPLRADSVEPAQKTGLFGEAAKPAEKPLNATWNPDSPIKFGNSTTSAGSMFGAAPSTSSPLFGQKAESTASTTNLFGAPKTNETPKDASKPSTSTSSLFGASKEPEKPASSVFGSAPSQDKPVSNLFGAPKAQEKPAEAKPASNLFGAPKEPGTPATNMLGAPKEPEKPTEQKPAASEESDKENDAQAPAKPLFGGFTPKPVESSGSSLFQPKPDAAPASKPAAPTFSFGASKPEDAKASPTPTTSLFGAQEKPKEAPVLTSSTLFGAPSKPAEIDASAASAEPVKAPLFGASSTAAPASNMFGQSAAAKPAAPTFAFGSTDSSGSKPLFGSGAVTPAAPSQPLFGGSPMKQDAKQDEPPAKKMFGASSEPASTGFSFGQSGSQSSAPSGGLFGASAPQTNGQTPAPSFSFGGTGGQSFNNPFTSNGAGPAAAPAASGGAGVFNFGGASSTTPAGGNSGASTPFQFGGNAPSNPAPGGSTFMFGSSAPSQPAASTSFQFGGNSTQAPSLNFTSASPQPPATNESNIFAPNPNPPGGNMFNLQPPGGGASSTGTNSPFNFGGASSLATTPATGTPEPTADREKITGPKPNLAAPGADGADDNEDKPHEQISLTEGGPGEEDETVIHEVRCKVLKFVPAGKDADKDSGDDKPKSKSPWSTQGVGPFRLLKNKSSGALRMLVRAEPRGHVVLNRGLLPNVSYTADAKYVKMTTSNETGDGLETWMIQVKTADMAKETAKILEDNKKSAEGSD